MRHINTHICLPPGLLSLETVRKILRLVLQDFRWFPPVRYGDGALKQWVLPGELGIDGMLAFYEGQKELWVAQSDHDFISIKPSHVDEEYPYVSSISWITREKSSERSEWRAAQVNQIKQLMTLVGSPLADVALDDDVDRKRSRLLSGGFTVRDYSEGLAGLFWRNFFGPPYVRMFGDRLRSLPPDVCTDLGDDIVLVQPYPLPGDADTEQGKIRERQLIQHLGPECFYDHERQLLPTRRPDVSSLPRPQGPRFPKPWSS